MKNNKKCACSVSPIIVLPGINHSPVYLYDKDGKRALDSKGREIGGTLLFTDNDGVKKMLPHLAHTAAATVITRFDMGFRKAVYDTACTAFSFQKCDDNGNMVNDLRVERSYCSMAEMDKDKVDFIYRMVPMKNLIDEIGMDHAYFFTFNLVGDPMKTADELNDYIQLVKEQTGHDKVTLLPISLGGTILTAYMDSYGKANNYRDIDKIVNIVACLNGTDIAGDLFERKFNTDNEFLRHRFIPSVIKEETGKATAGYVANCLLHIMPRRSFGAIFSGVIGGLLDTAMLNCPEVWAMLPSYRYDTISDRYLNKPEKSILKEKTDRFQQARLNLKENILESTKAGVKVNSISGSGISFGDIEYCFFGAVESKDRYNTDGIVNLSSATLGALGAPSGEILPDRDNKDNEYISPDNRVDASTAVLPDNTWIFLNQHHEVGNNDVVLNLAKALITGEINSVKDNPSKYPQYNYSCRTVHLRRWRIPDGIKAIDDVNSGVLKVTSEIKEELEKALSLAQNVVSSTIADSSLADKATELLNASLEKIGRFTPPEGLSIKEIKEEKAAELISGFMMRHSLPKKY